MTTMNLKERMIKMQMLRNRCDAILGSVATNFLLETFATMDTVDALRFAFRNQMMKEGPHKMALCTILEDKFLEYLTKTQMCALRHILDTEMVTNEKRKESYPFVMMALAGMTFQEATEQLKTAPEPDALLSMLLLPDTPKGNLN